MHRIGYIMFICGFVTVCLSACTPLTGANGQPIGVAVTGQDGRITGSMADDMIIIDVYSPNGIGSAAVRLLTKDYPQRILLRFHLSGLEALRFAYDTTVVTLSVSGVGEPVVYQQVALASDEQQEIAANSPYWMETKRISPDASAANGHPLRDEYIEVEIPPHFLQTQQPAFSLEWIDFYR